MNGRIIVTETAYNMRAMARGVLAGRWKPAVIVTMLFAVLCEVPAIIFNSFLSIENTVPLNVQGQVYYMSLPSTSILTIVYTILVVAPLTLGFNAFFLRFYRNGSNDTNLLYGGFSMFGKAVALYLLRAVFIFLWTMLLVVPGIIAAYRYSQAYFIMLDHPEMSCMECINESKRIMQGNKWKLFCIQLSFIGWVLLASIPAGIVTGIIEGVCTANRVAFLGGGKGGVFVLSLISFVFAAGTFWVDAYMQTANVAFYEVLTGKYAQAGFGQIPYTSDESGYQNYQTQNTNPDIGRNGVDLGMYSGRNDLYRQNVEGENDNNDSE